MWSFVHEKWNKRWLWTVMCRRTRQIVAFVIGDRSASDLSQALGTNSTSLRRLSKLQRFLGSLSTRLPCRNTCMRWQRKWTDQSHGTLVWHRKTILCAVRPKNIILFKVGCHARNRNTAIYHPSQPVTCDLTTTMFSTILSCFSQITRHHSSHLLHRSRHRSQ